MSYLVPLGLFGIKNDPRPKVKVYETVNNPSPTVTQSKSFALRLRNHYSP